MSAKLCSKSGCGAIARIGYPCKDWDCPQDVVSATEYRALLDTLAAKDTALADASDRIDTLTETVSSYSQVISTQQRRAESAEAELALARKALEKGGGNPNG